MSAPTLELYYFPQCPFCQRVERVIKQHNIKVEFKNIIEDQKSLEKLVQDTGRRTVPVLYIDNVPKPESSDIIDWITENVEKLEKDAN